MHLDIIKEDAEISVKSQTNKIVFGKWIRTGYALFRKLLKTVANVEDKMSWHIVSFADLLWFCYCNFTKKWVNTKNIRMYIKCSSY